MTTVSVTTVRNTVEVVEGAVTTVRITTAGPQGATGATGAAGPAGQGVPVGGTTGQALVKASGTNYDTTWTTLGGTGTVTSVATGAGLSGGPITTSGTISLANTAVVPGTYPLATVQVDAQGRITYAAAGSAPGTDLTYDATSRLLSSSTGADVTLPLATTTDAGLMSAADKVLVNYAATVTVAVRNNSGSTIPKGAAVYVTGSSGTAVTVALADASAESTAAGTLGLAQAAISNNANGTVIAVGELTGLDTSVLTEGALIWLSETTGGLTTTRPTQPAHGVVIGYCVKQGPGTSGIVYVKVDNGLELEELHDVLVVSPAAGQVLRRASDGLWKNAQLAYADLSGTPMLGTSAALNVGITAGTVAAGDDSRFAADLSYTAATRVLASSTGTDVTLPLADITNAGLQSAADKLKLDGIAAGAQVNVATDLSYTASTRLLESSTGTDVTLPLFTSTDAGLVGGSGGGTINFLRADGTWAAPAGGVSSVSGTAPIVSSGGSTPAISISAATTSAAGSMSAADKTKLDGIAAGAQVNVPTDLTYTAATRLLASSTGADVTLPLMSTSEAGLVPASGGGTTNFLRADGVFAAPPSGGGSGGNSAADVLYMNQNLI